MITLNSKQHDSVGQEKPQRFNFGGILKRNFTWKKSVNSLTSTLREVQFGYLVPSERDLSSDILSKDSSYHSSSAELAFVPAASQALTMSTFGVNYTTYAPYYCGESAAISSSESGSDIPFNTECISLLNSDLTSEMILDSVFDNYFCCSKPSATDTSDSIPYHQHSEEKITDYKTWGYHPVSIGDEFTSDISRYRVVRKLGWGHFSTVWLCCSLISGQYVALKIVKLGKNYSEAASDEVKILTLLQENSQNPGELPVVSLLDNFKIRGPNGIHIAMAFELMGANLLHLIYEHKTEKLKADSSQSSELSPYLMPVDILKSIVFQLLKATDFMHSRSIIHTDLKPENILLSQNGDMGCVFLDKVPSKFQILPSQPLRNYRNNGSPEIKVADLGNATSSSYHLSDRIQTRQYRAPEILLGHCWGALADVWSIGCLIFEFLTGDYLFEPNSGATFSKDEDHLAQIIELLGVFPSSEYLRDCSHYKKFFKDTETMRNIHQMKYWSLESVLEEKYKFNLQDDNIKLLCDLMLKCLQFDLDKRYDCGSLLSHPFFRQGAKYVKHECILLPNNNYKIPGFTCEQNFCGSI